MRLGRTITAEREKTESESERLKLRTKTQRRRMLMVMTLALGLTLIVGLTVMTVTNLIAKRRPLVQKPEKIKTELEIRDESGINYVTERIRDYVGVLERDLKDLGVTTERVVIPEGKTREVDIYLQGREEYYKCHLDRGTAETAEDMERMLRYLKKKDLKVRYVDVRLKGKAYYLPK